MANIITMAGRGKRFSDQGYLLPKPLIIIDGEPMIWKVIDTLPPSDKWIFVVREEHIREYNIDKVIKLKIPEAIITIDKDLLGGVSIFCAEEYLDPEEEVLIAGCDAGFLYDSEKYSELRKDSSVDCILWTFTKDKRITDKPKSWGYALLEEDGKTIKDMSVKIPVSDNPYKDHIVTATFYISSSRLLYQGIRKIISEGMKAQNGEYYLDFLPRALNLLKKKSVIFDVDLYIGWGTPEEFHKFEELLFFKEYKSLEDLNLPFKEIKNWERYFKNAEKK